MAKDNTDPPFDLDSDEIVEEILGDEDVPPDLSTLRGFLGKSDVAGYHRLFTDPTFKSWVDIRDVDIRFRRRIPDEDGFGGRSVVWVESGAKLVKGEVTTAAAETDFLSGAFGAETPRKPGLDAIDRARQVPNIAFVFGSVNPTPPGVACC